MAGRETERKEWGLPVAPILDVVLGTTREMLHRVDFLREFSLLCHLAVCCCCCFVTFLGFFSLGAAVT